jgi:hypothetical protein
MYSSLLNAMSIALAVSAVVSCFVGSMDTETLTAGAGGFLFFGIIAFIWERMNHGY